MSQPKAVCCAFLGFSLASMLHVAVLGERRARESAACYPFSQQRAKLLLFL
jgi:hypothetical protein